LVASLLPLGQGRPQGAARGQKSALLVACSGYAAGEFRELPGTIKEMKEFRQTLIDSGWPEANIVFLHDENNRQNERSVRRTILARADLLLGRLERGDTLVVALNGQGIHYKGDRVGYFVPVDGELERKGSLVPMNGPGGMFEKLQRCKAGRKLLLVNACRNDPADNTAFAARQL